MKETDIIKKAARLIQASTEFHALIVEGPAGWGKTTTIHLALDDDGLDAAHLGAYSTPLNFFNFLHNNSTSVVLIDDCAGLFGNDLAMSILKAATWPQRNGRRIIRWGSSSSKAVTEEFEFQGKLIIVCNRFPTTADAVAVKSRSLPHKMTIELGRAKQLLMDASQDQKHFPNGEIAKKAAIHLCGILNDETLPLISYRTLKMVYELITLSPDDWKVMANNFIAQKGIEPTDLIKRLNKDIPNVKEQEQIFLKETGFKRRTFYKYRRELNLSRKYGQ